MDQGPGQVISDGQTNGRQTNHYRSPQGWALEIRGINSIDTQLANFECHKNELTISPDFIVFVVDVPYHHHHWYCYHQYRHPFVNEFKNLVIFYNLHFASFKNVVYKQ